MSNRITQDLDPRHEALGPTTRIPRMAIRIGGFARRAAGVLIFSILTVLEPFVRLILMTLATLGMFVTIVFGFLIGAENFPKWFMLGISASCFLLLAAYYAAMRILGNVSTKRDLGHSA